MIINPSEMQIVLNELYRRDKKELGISTYLGRELVCIIDQEKEQFYKQVNKKKWTDFIDSLGTTFGLSTNALDELPNYGDIIQTFVASGLMMPEGLEGLKEDIDHYFSSKLGENRRKRAIIALDTNQLIQNTMSQYLEKSYSLKNPTIRNFISYVISSWVIFERDNFLKREKSAAVKELQSKLQKLNYILGEKYDKGARIGYSILAEMKKLEKASDILESNETEERKQQIINSKNERDLAIINEYSNYSKSLKNTKFYYTTADEQGKALAKDHLEFVSIKTPIELPNILPCNLEQSANLIYYLTLLFGYLRISNYNIQTSIFFGGKKLSDWENMLFNLESKDEIFMKQIEKLIMLTKKMNVIF